MKTYDQSEQISSSTQPAVRSVWFRLRCGMPGALLLTGMGWGSSMSTSVDSANNVFGDNFCASSGVMPNPGINVAGGETDKLVLSWPTNAPVCWQVITHAPGIVGAHFTLTNSVSTDIGFYWLSR